MSDDEKRKLPVPRPPQLPEVRRDALVPARPAPQGYVGAKISGFVARANAQRARDAEACLRAETGAAAPPEPPSPSLLDDPAAFARGFWNRLMKKDKNEPSKPSAQPPRRGSKPKLVVDNEPPKTPDGPKR